MPSIRGTVQDIMIENEIFPHIDQPFVDMIKKQLLSYDIKAECCKSSFSAGVEAFERSRKNKYSEQVSEYISKLKRKKKKQFFEELAPKGYTLKNDGEGHCPTASAVCPNCGAHLVRGAFLSCGRASMTDKGITVEMVMPNDECAKLILGLAQTVDIKLKSTVRRGEHLLYCRKAQEVEDLLNYIGAVSASFYVMNSKIEKGIIMKAARLTNCDANNLIKTADAAARQIEAINAIVRHDAMKQLSPALRETAMLRLENPSEPLDSLTELHGGNITRSGVNHRLQKIVALASKNGYIK